MGLKKEGSKFIKRKESEGVVLCCVELGSLVCGWWGLQGKYCY